jgi:hypothetical protein
VARTILVSVVTEDSDNPVRVEKVSSFVVIEEARTKFARNSSCENADDVKKLANKEEVYAVDTVIVHPNILETEIVLLIIVDANRDDTIIF